MGPCARQTAEGEFAGKAHPSEKGNKAEINQQERRAAVLAHAVREHPDVAYAHGGADRGKDEADAVLKLAGWFCRMRKLFLSAAAVSCALRQYDVIQYIIKRMLPKPFLCFYRHERGKGRCICSGP